MPVQSLTNATTPVIGAQERDTSEVSKLDFMTLLVAQIQNQDPTSPMESAEFTSQITEFTMLDELTAMNDKLTENIAVSQSMNNTAMLALVGKSVTVEGNGATITDGVSSENTINAKGPGQALIEVKDSNGNVVDSYARDISSGLNDITWDGLDNDGNAFPDGQYTIEATVSNNEIDVPFNVLETGAVEGLRYENNVAVVQVNGHEFYVSEIYKVS